MAVAIPTLCNYRGLSPYGACRICLVEIDTAGGPKQVAACSHPVEDNLVVRTDTDGIRESRRTILELLLAQAPDSTELAGIAAGLGIRSTPFEAAPEGKCILCGLCVSVCGDLMERGAISLYGRGGRRAVATAFREPTDQCQACGACAFVCPTGAIDLATITARRMKPHITDFDRHLSARPCIDLAHPQASPRIPSIDRENCVHFTTGECGLCSKVCQAGAIDYDQPEETVRLEVGAVVLTPGFETFDARRRGEFGFGFAPNVLTNVQFERLLSASGPTAGARSSTQRRAAARAVGVHPVRGFARHGLRQRLLLLDLLHGRDQGGDPGQGARAGPGRDRVLPRHARLRQGFRPLLRAGAEPAGRAVPAIVHLPDLRDAGDERTCASSTRVPR